ncbi:MAG TPA: DinB family protein [Dehalococcoidia bacterium]|nr:DinB family protein [Dehalococcoidia bacterium]
MPGPRVEELVSLLDLAFDGDDETSLMANLRNVDEATWNTVPQGGGRTIAEIAAHAGLAPWVYADFAFGAGGPTWDSAVAEVVAAARSMEQTVEWMREGHSRFVAEVAALDDGDLDESRPAHWGEQQPLRKLVAVLVSHASYHAGEINHARSLIRGTDRWDYFA